MKKLMFILILVLSASAILAQDSDKIEYQTLSVQKDGFIIDVPKDFKLTSEDEKEDKYRHYGYYSPDVYLFIRSDKDTEKSLNKTLINWAGSNNAKISQVEIKNFKATEYDFTEEPGFYHKILIITGETRNLIFHSVSTSKKNSTVKRFFSSLKFSKSAFAAKNKEKEVKQPEEKYGETNNGNGLGLAGGQGEGEAYGIGPGRGSGQGGGVGDGGNSEKSSVIAPKVINTSLKLLSKPRPSYTDLARIYNMQGTVRLRVTFLADGQIGTISALQKVPFGLTLQAIAAAKSIKFEPPIKDGVPYAITKVVEFNFTIY